MTRIGGAALLTAGCGALVLAGLVLPQGSASTDQSPKAPAAASSTAPCPRTQAAVQEARTTLSQFIQHLRAPSPRQEYFSVLASVPGLDGTVQDVWIDGLSYGDGRFVGTVSGSVPKGVGLRQGQSITVTPANVRDWMIIEDGRMRGGYTVAVTKTLTR